MAVLGISCKVDKGRFLVRGVVLNEGRAEQVFAYRATSAEDEALQLRSLQNALATRLADLHVDAAVVRVADHFKGRGITDGVSRRLHAEGAMLATLRASVELVRALSGREIGTACGSSKDEVLAAATEMLQSAPEATAAALAADQLREAQH